MEDALNLGCGKGADETILVTLHDVDKTSRRIPMQIGEQKVGAGGGLFDRNKQCEQERSRRLLKAFQHGWSGEHSRGLSLLKIPSATYIVFLESEQSPASRLGAIISVRRVNSFVAV
jgi:hypothetical protein